MSRALLLSAYDAGSHRAWRECLVDNLDDFSWQTCTLPPRNFPWRFRSNALSWGVGEFPDEDFDVVLATSATNLAALLGLRPRLGQARKVVYFHENQFAYPSRDDDGIDAHMAVQEILTASAADVVIFNSEWNRDSFFEGAEAFLRLMPDGVPTGVLERIEPRVDVIPVPISGPVRTARRDPGPLRLVWNHRWEFDKGPEVLLELMRGLRSANAAFELAVVGQSFRTIPESLLVLRDEFHAHITQWGWLESRSEYLELLRRSDVVLSTTHHEFQGIAVIEALMAGCRAWVPDSLVYPEYVPEDQRWPANALEAAVEGLARWCDDPALLERLSASELDRFRPNAALPRYREILS